MNNIYGYIRVSTISQREDRQWAALEEFGIPRENVPDGFEDISFANDWVSLVLCQDLKQIKMRIFQRKQTLVL